MITLVKCRHDLNETLSPANSWLYIVTTDPVNSFPYRAAHDLMANVGL